MDVWLARLAGLDSGDILTWILWRNYKINGGEKNERREKKRTRQLQADESPT
ncbi:hypothetical protein ES705_28988 [subsurface metagenome]